MGTRTTPIHRKPLVDPAACGVRLGVELRTAAEQVAWSEGLCLSHWVKKLVEEFVAKANEEPGANLTARSNREIERADAPVENSLRVPSKDALQSAFDAAYAGKVAELSR